ncbi:UDP-N-acetylglucosamine--N-acetylmuramyl-(pentapeptide) pyrophosphoryl-undecaprenol N-acetylglucosamine transferase [Candidatus Daviesbacteria bacterium]|nr:UDP-N-acetylglucosamine--N-acetylmuramyl-(pentapeptide) pyrophosphoryl-undecaprenol N-acetylglucosamine transferase [Candidatus Daviesbacteria bacterium]
MNVLLAGAHFTPAVAVIEVLKDLPNIKLVYVGRKTTLEGDPSLSAESQVLPKLGVKFIPITTGRLQRNLSFYTFISLLKIPVGFVQSFFIIVKEKPDVLLSFGGYVSVPLVIVAWLFSIPIIVHEQTMVSGLANKISAIFADKIAYSFSVKKFSKKEVLTGNPLRGEIINYKDVILTEGFEKIIYFARNKKLPLVLVTGGNQGSHTLNVLIEKSLEELLKTCCIIHQTGDSNFKDYDRLRFYQTDRYLPVKFIGNGIGKLIKYSDLVVSRAGANTLIELSFFEKPAIVIPLPYLYQDEQNKNADYFEKLGLVQKIPQKDLNNADSLVKKIKECLKDLESLNQKAKGARQVVFKDAAKRLAIETISLVNR